MRNVTATLLALAAIWAEASFAQTTAPGPGAATTSVKAVQPGLFEVAGPRVNEVVAAGITKITATPGKGWRSIAVESPWGASYFPWPKGIPAVPFTITTTGGAAGTATINAPGFNKAKQDDYKAAIEKIVPFAIAMTGEARNWSQGSGR